MGRLQKRSLVSAALKAIGGIGLSALALSVAPSVPAAPIDLGAAANYSVFAIDSLAFNGPGVINGNVAVGHSTNFAAPAQINGTVFENASVPAQGNITPTGGFSTVDLTAAIADAKNAASTASALSATQTFSALGSNATLTGNGAVNVIDVGAGGISLSSGLLTLSGSASDVFIINDTGNFTFSNSGIALTGGVKPENVLFNITGNVALTGGGNANFAGIILAPFSDISVHDKTLTGAVIGNTIEDTSGFKINSVSVPEPTGMALVGFAAVGLLARRRRAA